MQGENNIYCQFTNYSKARKCKHHLIPTVLLDSLGCSGQCLESLEHSRHSLDCPGCSGHSLEHFRLCLWQGTVRTMPHTSSLCCGWNGSLLICVLLNIMSQTHPLCLDLLLLSHSCIYRLQRSRLFPQSYSLLCSPLGPCDSRALLSIHL